MPRDNEPQNPEPIVPIGSDEGGSQPTPEPIKIPPDWGTYSEPDVGIRIVNVDYEIKIGQE